MLANCEIVASKSREKIREFEFLAALELTGWTTQFIYKQC